MEIDSVLRQIPLFASLTEDGLRQLIANGQLQTVPPGTVVCEEGQSATSLFVLLAGRVSVYKGSGTSRVQLATMERAAFFGESAMFDDVPRTATVIAVTECELLVVQRPALMQMLTSTRSADATAAMLASVFERLRHISERFFSAELARRTMDMEMEAARHRSVAEMVAGVAHELNTPLGVASTGVSMIERLVGMESLTAAAADDPQARSVLEDLEEAAGLVGRNIRRAHRLVESFKDVSVQQFVDERTTLDLSQLVAEVIDLFEIQARRAKLVVQVDDQLAPDERSWIGYGGRLTQVLINLLANCERHAYPGGVGGTVTLTVRLDRQAQVPSFVITVGDQGRGIEPGALTQIFTPFFTTARGSGGTGLGLAIVRNIVVDGLQGTIEVDSEVGRGTVFTVRIPQASDPTPIQAQTQAPTQTPTQAQT